MIDIKSYDYEELKAYFAALGEPAFRATQVYDWLHCKHATDFGQMTNLSKSLREKLAADCTIAKAEPVQILSSALDGTKKFLFRFADGNVIESVFLPYKHGNSVCISTQVGCRMGCRFCASTLDGMTRNLTAAEMLEEVYRISALTGERISNVVLMGAGEPLDNFDEVTRFLRMISDEHGAHISQRNLTLSTCGLVPEIRRLSESDYQITLAISLHAPTQEKRETLMPIARRYPLTELIPACRDYFAKTGRRLTFEYSLIDGVNDTDEDAENLCRLLKNLPCHVNLIALNPIKERNFCESGGLRPIKFKNLLEKNRINVTIRREMGRDINGACGQLRKSYVDSESS
ncbi:MAG: 23S rRNA (adenine(2503)-C(2))-methyltransferase RlmN [Lachnospiraceae bacterium]|nr:23S rRNA (adenine(2503)-C(2))-methyltransferase RlmN [Lachnospiraceae bacterium]